MKRITVIVIRRFFPQADDKEQIMSATFRHRLGIFIIGAIWAMVAALVPVVSSLLGEFVDDLQSYGSMPLDWHHIKVVAMYGIGGGVLNAMRSYYAEYKALLRLPDDIQAELDQARAMRSGPVMISSFKTETTPVAQPGQPSVTTTVEQKVVEPLKVSAFEKPLE